MIVARLRLAAIACFIAMPIADAQSLPSAGPSVGEIFDVSRQDVTLPIATSDNVNGDTEEAVTIPVENLATPMRCMAAWSYLAVRTIHAPEDTLNDHPEFTEATASAHWQHWLRLDLEMNQGVMSADFHPRREAAERVLNTAIAADGPAHLYRTLGACYVRPAEREIADPTILLRNFMIDYQGLPDEYAVPVLQRQLRAFPISEISEAPQQDDCDQAAADLQADARDKVVRQCFERGGILASTPKLLVEDLDGACRATSTVQCENIP